MNMLENVARELDNAEVTVVNKNGVAKKAISVKIGNVGAVIYEENFAGCATVAEAVAKAKELIGEREEDMRRIGENVSFYEDYDKVKEMLKVRLLSKDAEADVFRLATSRGFKGLKIVPYVDVPASLLPQGGSIRVQTQHIERWGVTEKEVIDLAIKNTAKDISTQSLLGFMAELTGDDEFVDIPDGPMIVSNKAKCFGASAILGLLPSLKKKYKEGFFVLPSSVHEVLVMPKGFNGFDLEGLTQMVQQVNATEVMPEERLADVAFEF